MQISKIVLYKDREHCRIVPFATGRVNIIVGDSKTGKSALIDIVDYCLGSGSCHIASGVIRDNVYWFAVVVDFGQDAYLLARQNPDIKQVSAVLEMYLVKVQNDYLPTFDDIYPNTNVDTVRQFLAAKIGLHENVQIPDDGGTRKSLPVTFMHSRQYCYQPQSLIANKDMLFYHTLDSFQFQALKDAFPYLVGAIQDDVLVIEQQIKSLCKEQRSLKRSKREREEMANEQSNLVYSLLEEAKTFGLVSFNSLDSIKDPIGLMQDVLKWTPSETKALSQTNVETEIQELVNQRNELNEQLGDIQEKLLIATQYQKEGVLYQSELKLQHQRLKSVELLPNEDICTCPLCNQQITEQTPQVHEILSSFHDISIALEETQQQTERTQKYVATLIRTESAIKEQISQTEASIHALYKQDEQARKQRDLNVQRGKVIGRISLFLEKLQVPEHDNLDEEIERLEKEISKLRTKISKSTKEELLAAKTAVINSYMNQDWKRKLDLEDEDAIVNFDSKRMQIYSISREEEKYTPLDQMGSGANWVGFHLLIHFALHKFFVKNDRPIPHFLMLDQPSQIYFPSDGGECKDVNAVKRMFRFIFDRTDEMNGAFQVILTEHANFQELEFRQNVVESWYNGDKLIPEDWYTDKDTNLHKNHNI